MNVVYIGNFGPEHSTESHVAAALRSLGHDLVCLQENEVGTWQQLSSGDALTDRDMLLWTRTGWDWPSIGIAVSEIHRIQREMLATAKSMGIPTVGYHLDRWWGLQRQTEVPYEPFFGVSLLVTADGGHDAEWQQAGINHHWMSPGVSEFECGGGTYRPEMASDVAFVGSWMPGYHREYPMRANLIRYLQDDPRCRLWPAPGEHAVRGVPLRDLYSSVKILIGDSCLNGGIHHYWSDRIPETLGRGGFLIHPEVKGLEDDYTPGEHLITYPLGDFRRLTALIDYWLLPENDEERQRIAAAGRKHVLANHTYTVRMQQLENLLNERSLLCARS